MAKFEFTRTFSLFFNEILRSVYGWITISLLSALFIFTWPWSLVFSLGSILFLGAILNLYRTILWKASLAFYFILLGLLIGWGLYINFSSFSFLTLYFHAFCLSAVIFIFSLGLYLNPYIYTLFLQQDYFNHHFWFKRQSPYWNLVFKILAAKKFKYSLAQFPVIWLQYRAAQKKIPKRLEIAIFDYWCALPYRPEAQQGQIDNRNYPFMQRALETMISIILLPNNFREWLGLAQQKPQIYGLIDLYLAYLNRGLSQYIENPGKFSTADIYQFNLEQIEARFSEIIPIIPASETAILEKVELAQGLMIVVLAMNEELRGLA